MTTTDIALPSEKVAASRADFIGQGTAVEQARAVAEVEGQVMVARRFPRDMAEALAEMRETCAQLELADRSFYKYPRGGQTVSGASVHLARELARCFRNVEYGISELRRDDDGHYSEMKAWAWDVQNNTRASQTFVVPHKRDKRGGPPEMLTDLRDIYEQSANQAARRMREAIFSILPTWFVEEAKSVCAETLQKGVAGKTLPQAIADAVTRFEQEYGVSVDRLEVKLGRKRGEWTAHDVAQLRVSYKSLQQGTVTVEEEFPRRVTAAEISREDPAPASPTTPADEKPKRGRSAGSDTPGEDVPGDVTPPTLDDEAQGGAE